MTFLIKYGKVVRSTYYFHEKKIKKTSMMRSKT